MSMNVHHSVAGRGRLRGRLRRRRLRTGGAVASCSNTIYCCCWRDASSSRCKDASSMERLSWTFETICNVSMSSRSMMAAPLLFSRLIMMLSRVCQNTEE